MNPDRAQVQRQSSTGSVRRVKIVSVYARITKRGRGVGLIAHQLRDADTGEVLRSVRLRLGNFRILKQHAERHGYQWAEKTKDADNGSSPAAP